MLEYFSSPFKPESNVNQMFEQKITRGIFHPQQGINKEISH
jgi:hypothetical protein